GAVGQRGPQRLDVLRWAQRGVDLVDGVVVAQEVGGEDEVVRRDLGGDVDSTVLGPPDPLHAAGAGDVGDVDPAAGVAGQHDVPGDDGLLGHARPARQS